MYHAMLLAFAPLHSENIQHEYLYRNLCANLAGAKPVWQLLSLTKSARFYGRVYLNYRTENYFGPVSCRRI